MTHSLMILLVLIVFCCAIGYGLGVNHAAWWFMVVICTAIWITVPIAYLVGLITDG